METGDIYSVELPSSNGREQMGLRPAIIIQTSEFTNQLPTVLIVPFTSNRRALDFSSTFLVTPDSDNQLNRDSVALVFQLRAIDKRRLGNRIGRLKVGDLEKLKTRVKELMGL